MVKLLALYKKPEDQAEFDRHYFDIHLPLAQQMPGLQRTVVSKILGAPSGESEFYMLAEMHFEDIPALKNALSSPRR